MDAIASPPRPRRSAEIMPRLERMRHEAEVNQGTAVTCTYDAIDDCWRIQADGYMFPRDEDSDEDETGLAPLPGSDSDS